MLKRLNIFDGRYHIDELGNLYNSNTNEYHKEGKVGHLTKGYHLTTDTDGNRKGFSTFQLVDMAFGPEVSINFLSKDNRARGVRIEDLSTGKFHNFTSIRKAHQFMKLPRGSQPINRYIKGNRKSPIIGNKYKIIEVVVY